MTVEVIVNGRSWKVTLDPAGKTGAFSVTINGKNRVVNASWIDAETISMIDGGVAREIRLHPRGDHRAVGVEVGGCLYDALVSRRKRERESRAMGATGASGAVRAPERGATGAFRVSAPMPGRIVRVLVAVGDRVSARQGVIVVEAMKMENELRTPRDGIVKEVLVEPGAAVETGAVLVVIDQ